MHLALLAPRFTLRFGPGEPVPVVELEPAVNLRTRHSIHLNIRHRSAA